MINSKLCSASAVIIALAAAIAAPGTAVAEGTEDTAEVGEPAGNMIARDVLDTIKANYVLTPKIPAITKTIKAGLASGRYASLEGRALADRLNEDLTAAAHDKHLAIQFDPARASMISGPMGDEINEGPEWERMAQTMNHGVAEMRLMDGNVRYMNLVGFAWTGAKSAAALDNAMRFLSEGDAAIIDLRYNGGGSPRAIEYLFSHFVEPGKTLMTFYMGGGKAPTHHAALRELPAGRLSGKPLYVLTSKMSISAAEAFAALVQDYHVGDIVGETTAGAAYRNSYFPIAGKYLLSVSVGRGEIGPSKIDWEGVGITPTIKSDMASALDVAHLAALNKLALSARGPEKMMIQAKATMLQAKLQPKTAAHPLQSYVGNYDDRIVTVAEGALFGQRTGGPRTRLIPLGGDAFIMESDPTTTVEYSFVGEQPAAMVVIRVDGSRASHPRSN